MRIRPLFLLSILLLFFPNAGAAHSDLPVPAWIEPVLQIEPIRQEDLNRLREMGAMIDGVWGDRARIYASPDLLVRIETTSFSAGPLRVTRIPSPVRARTGEDYPSLDAIAAEMEAIAQAHPDLCRLYTVGRSLLDRPLLMMKISDHPDLEEDEPEVLYLSTMHGDEPVGTLLCLDLIRLFVEGYGLDPEITRLVNEVEIWIMPMMNPDGYAGIYRTNAQGYDLNRSFPDRVIDPVNTTDGRPPETQHLMNWVYAHSPVLAASFHTGALVVNYPYDADPDPYARYSAAPDDPLFIQQSLAYASLNPPMSQSPWFDNGIINGVDWYTVYGGIQDWLYVWQGCNAVTVELSDAKRPSFSEMGSLWIENREAMLAYMAWSLKGVRGIVTDSITGLPIQASVRVEGIDHDVYTDPDVGDYHRMLLSGTYTLRFRAAGYVEKRVQDLVVGSRDALRIHVSLDPVSPGDVTGDGRIDLADAVAALQILSGLKPSAQVALSADVDQDGKIGLGEAIFCLKGLLGIPPIFLLSQ